MFKPIHIFITVALLLIVGLSMGLYCLIDEYCAIKQEQREAKMIVTSSKTFRIRTNDAAATQITILIQHKVSFDPEQLFMLLQMKFNQYSLSHSMTTIDIQNSGVLENIHLYNEVMNVSIFPEYSYFTPDQIKRINTERAKNKLGILPLRSA